MLSVLYHESELLTLPNHHNLSRRMYPMEPTNNGDTETIEISYHQAKVEHYIERAEELVRMARYSAARKALSNVFSLEPNHAGGLALEKHINAALVELAATSGSPFHASNGNARQFRRGELVLIVEQDERLLSSLTEALHRYGFGALGAGGFDEAIDTLKHFRPSLIVSEVNFENGPVGYDLYLWVRNNQELSRTPFLYLATCVTREMLIAGKRMGVDEFITKPLDEEVVMASILNSLSRLKKKVA